eukprot:6475668-Pyramimonas_sp.AAC.1
MGHPAPPRQRAVGARRGWRTPRGARGQRDNRVRGRQVGPACNLPPLRRRVRGPGAPLLDLPS